MIIALAQFSRKLRLSCAKNTPKSKFKNRSRDLTAKFSLEAIYKISSLEVTNLYVDDVGPCPN